MHRISGEKLRLWILRRGFSQGELEERAAVHSDTLRSILESGRQGKACRAGTVRKLTSTLQVEPDDLLVDEQIDPSAVSLERVKKATPDVVRQRPGYQKEGNGDQATAVHMTSRIERVIAVPFRKEALGVLPQICKYSTYELVREVKQIDMLGLNLYVSWLGDTEFVSMLERRRPKSEVRVILPKRDSAQLTLHDRKQRMLLGEVNFFDHYEKTLQQLKRLSLLDSVKYVDSIVVHAGIVRLGALAIVTPYLGFRRGSNSPALIVEREVAPRTFGAFCDDFDLMWKIAVKR